jgi:hypothetical protein
MMGRVAEPASEPDGAPKDDDESVGNSARIPGCGRGSRAQEEVAEEEAEGNAAEHDPDGGDEGCSREPDPVWVVPSRGSRSWRSEEARADAETVTEAGMEAVVVAETEAEARGPAEAAEGRDTVG